MSSKDEMIVVQKAMVLDILRMLEKNEKESYTVEEIKKLAYALIDAKEQAP